ncbi:MAG: hypothetical protein ACLQUY_25855 [Ktedonobacterales bacterium]
MITVLAIVVLLLGALGYLAVVAPRLWQSYTDPASGFSFRYPPGWLLTTAADGSNPTLVNPANGATISVYAVTLPGSPQTVIGSAAPATATGLQHRNIAGDAAIDFVLPGAQAGGGNTDPGQLLRLHLVVVATANTAGSTNEYTLALTQPPASTSSRADALFEQLVGTFSPATASSWLPLLSQSGVPRPVNNASGKNCNAICWADMNWDVNDYTADASGQECASYDANADDGAGAYVDCGLQVLSTLGDFQPDYQCSEFVTRALAQNGLVPGLASGGYGGISTAVSNTTTEFGGYSYNSYPFTAADQAGNGDMIYNLLGVGNPGTPGLYDYLVSSGIGVNLHQDLSKAQPGDVVFFYTSSIADANREHVMLITSVLHYSSSREGLGGWDALLDGHNRAAYHSLLSTLTSSDYPFEIVHLAARRGTAASFATTGAGWEASSDANQEPLVSVSTTSATAPSASATAHFAPAGACILAAYIPDVDAIAVASFQITLANGGTKTVSVDESAVDGWVLLQAWQPPGTGSPPTQVTVGNDTGSDGLSLGLGPVVALCTG